MPLLDHVERAELRNLADGIVGSLTSNQWMVHAWNAAALVAPRLASVRVILAATQGRYDDLTKIKATSNVTVHVPIAGLVPSRVTRAQVDDLKRVIFGVLAHECTHVLQKADTPATFAASIDLEARLASLAAPTADDWFDLYVGQPLEQAARAAQAAAEVEALLGANAPEATFYGSLPVTEVSTRTAGKIEGSAGATGKVASWWRIFSAMAWDAYR